MNIYLFVVESSDMKLAMTFKILNFFAKNTITDAGRVIKSLCRKKMLVRRREPYFEHLTAGIISELMNETCSDLSSS